MLLVVMIVAGGSAASAGGAAGGGDDCRLAVGVGVGAVPPEFGRAPPRGHLSASD